MEEDEAALMQVQVRPNPTKNDVNISFEGMRGTTIVKVYDANGNLVDDFGLEVEAHTEYEYSMAPYSSGIYMFAFANGNGIKTVRVIKK